MEIYPQIMDHRNGHGTQTGISLLRVECPPVLNNSFSMEL